MATKKATKVKAATPAKPTGYYVKSPGAKDAGPLTKEQAKAVKRYRKSNGRDCTIEVR